MEKKNRVIIGGVVALVVLILLFVWQTQLAEAPRIEDVNNGNQVPGTFPRTPIDVKNTHYMIEARNVSLADGVALSQAAEGSATVVRTSVLEGPAFADVDGDDLKDAVVILRDEPGGSGIFYYVSTLLSGSGGKSTNAILLGDRIRIRLIQIENRIINITISERAAGEAFAVSPTHERTLHFRINSGVLEAI